MFWLLFLVSIVSSEKALPPWRVYAVPSCNEIPPGSTMTENSGIVITFQEPIPAGKCTVSKSATGNAFAESFNCSGKTGSQNFYNASSCAGNALGSNPIAIKGTCKPGGCAGVTVTQYGTVDCTGTPSDVRTNEYMYWGDGTCQYNMTQTCVGGQPQTKFFSNTACTGTPVFTMIAGECNRRNARSSQMITATDSPC
eukprot:UN02477